MLLTSWKDNTVGPDQWSTISEAGEQVLHSLLPHSKPDVTQKSIHTTTGRCIGWEKTQRYKINF